MKKNLQILENVLIIIFGFFLFAFIAALPVFILWNWLIPDIMGFKSISLSQSLGINFLCSILFKNSSNVSKKSDPKL